MGASHDFYGNYRTTLRDLTMGNWRQFQANRDVGISWKYCEIGYNEDIMRIEGDYCRRDFVEMNLSNAGFRPDMNCNLVEKIAV